MPRPESGKAKVLGLTQVVRDWYQTGVTLSKKRGLLSHILISTGDLAVMACINLTLVPIVNSGWGHLGGSNALLSSKLFGRMPAEQRGRISGFRFLVISLVTAASVWATSMGLGVGEASQSVLLP